MDCISTCPECGRQSRHDADQSRVRCTGCGHRYDPWDDDDPGFDDDTPDYGGAFDGFTVTSDADPGL